MALKLADRVLTIVVTATLTSAAWIVGGGSFMRYAEDQKAAESAKAKTEVVKAGSPLPTSGSSPAAEKLLDSKGASAPAAVETDQLVVPVLNVKPQDLQDTFTDKRGEGAPMHEALDIIADKGTTVIAAAPGLVEKLFTSAGGGKTLYIRTLDRRTIHYYAHLDEYATGLQEGQRVRRGQRLGTVGSTGDAAAQEPHLHFAILRTTAEAEWWEPAVAVNPYPLLTGDIQRP